MLPSDVMMAGTPNLQIHPENNAAAASAVGVSQGKCLHPAANSFYNSQNVIKSIGGCEGAHQVNVDVGETALRHRDQL